MDNDYKYYFNLYFSVGQIVVIMKEFLRGSRSKVIFFLCLWEGVWGQEQLR